MSSYPLVNSNEESMLQGPQSEAPGLRSGYILVVDDEPSTLRFMGAGLRAEGFEVTEAVDGEQAVQAVEESSPDLMILDIMMPKMDGFGVCRRVRERSHVPIMILSALADLMDKVKSLNIGADDYLVKPFGINELQYRPL